MTEINAGCDTHHHAASTSRAIRAGSELLTAQSSLCVPLSVPASTVGRGHISMRNAEPPVAQPAAGLEPTDLLPRCIECIKKLFCSPAMITTAHR